MMGVLFLPFWLNLDQCSHLDLWVPWCIFLPGLAASAVTRCLGEHECDM